MSIREDLQDCYEQQLLFADEFDDCIIGVSEDFGKVRVVYCIEKMIENQIQKIPKDTFQKNYKKNK